MFCSMILGDHKAPPKSDRWRTSTDHAAPSRQRGGDKTAQEPTRASDDKTAQEPTRASDDKTAQPTRASDGTMQKPGGDGTNRTSDDSNRTSSDDKTANRTDDKNRYKHTRHPLKEHLMKSLTIEELKHMLSRRKIDFDEKLDKQELVNLLVEHKHKKSDDSTPSADGPSTDSAEKGANSTRPVLKGREITGAPAFESPEAAETNTTVTETTTSESVWGEPTPLVLG